jgi:hypothetical protein
MQPSMDGADAPLKSFRRQSPATPKDDPAWTELRSRMERILDNEVRVFKGRDLELFDRLLDDVDRERVARRVGALLMAGPLCGDLLKAVAQRFTVVVGAPVVVSTATVVEAHDIDQWTTVPEATTMERPISGPLEHVEASLV